MIGISPPSNGECLISTPMLAYRWCRAAGLSHDQALAVTRSRATFEYFLAACS